VAGQVIQLNKDGRQRGSISLPGALTLCGVALVSILQISPRGTDRDVTAIFAHDISFDEAAARVNNAGAEVLSVGPAGNIVVARLTNSADTQSLRALREAGAWLVLSADTQNLCSAATQNGAAKPNNVTNS
jgi:hypothetical protein